MKKVFLTAVFFFASSSTKPLMKVKRLFIFDGPYLSSPFEILNGQRFETNVSNIMTKHLTTKD